MSAVRIVFLMIVPALIAALVPAMAIAFDVTHQSAATLRIVLIVTLGLVALYACGMAMLARSDHRLIVARLSRSNG